SKICGGLFVDMTIHDFDMTRYLLDAEVMEVFAVGNTLIEPTIAELDDVDTAIITMKMSDGTLVVIDNSRQAVYGYDQRVEVFGSKGQASIANDTKTSLVISDNQ
ncbi:unnamed protein product, partial [Didymodactylos carnosus]